MAVFTGRDCAGRVHCCIPCCRCPERSPVVFQVLLGVQARRGALGAGIAGAATGRVQVREVWEVSGGGRQSGLRAPAYTGPSMIEYCPFNGTNMGSAAHIDDDRRRSILLISSAASFPVSSNAFVWPLPLHLSVRLLPSPGLSRLRRKIIFAASLDESLTFWADARLHRNGVRAGQLVAELAGVERRAGWAASCRVAG